jgi:uncharacterized RDD family membrane protein YckC
VIGLLAVLQSNLPAANPMSLPENRRALEIYLAGQHGAILRDTAFWSGPMGQPAQRRMVEDIAARYPSVTAEELERSRQTLEPLMGRLLHPQNNVVVAGPVLIVGFLLAAMSLIVLLFSIVSSLAVPGGAATRMIGLAVVKRDGTEIGRWRSLARTLIAWMPIFVGLIPLPAFEKLGFESTIKLCLGLSVGVMIAGVVWTIAAADRGLHDRIVGTWVVPR